MGGYATVELNRRQIIDSYRYMHDKKLSLIAYLLLRIGLLEEYGINSPISIVTDISKKPTIKEHPEIKFNISHCENCVSCAVTDVEVGLDVQNFVNVDSKMEELFMSEEEKKLVHNSSERNMQSIRLWTIKEAYGKYFGDGILYNLCDVDFSKCNEDSFTWGELKFNVKQMSSYILTTCCKKELSIKKLSIEQMQHYIKTFNQVS